MRKLLLGVLLTAVSCGVLSVLGEGENEHEEVCKPEVEITAKTTTSVTLSWKCNATATSPIKGYFILMWNLQKFGIARHIRIPKGVNTYTVKNVSCGTYYSYDVFADADHSASYSEVKTTLGETVFPQSDDFLEIGETSVTLNLDQWQTTCTVEAFTVWFIPGKGPRGVDRMDSSIKQMVLKDLRPDTEHTLCVSANAGPFDCSAHENPHRCFEDFSKENCEAKYDFKTLCNRKGYFPNNNGNNKLLEEFDTSLIVHMEKFSCFTTFTVEYRESNGTQWTMVSKDIKADQGSLLIQDIPAGKSYVLRITGRSKYGESIKEYDFSTKQKVCGNWIPHKKKCIKVIKEAGRVTKKEAQIVCQKLQENEDIPRLVKIAGKDDFGFLFDILYETLSPKCESSGRESTEYYRKHFSKDAWLGLHSNNGEDFRWDDGSEVGLTKWVNTSINGKDQGCGIFMARRNIFGWGREEMPALGKTSCDSRNYVVCEKPVPWSFDRLSVEVATLKRE